LIVLLIDIHALTVTLSYKDKRKKVWAEEEKNKIFSAWNFNRYQSKYSKHARTHRHIPTHVNCNKCIPFRRKYPL